MRHVLICRHVGLVIARQNEVCGEILYISRQAFPSNCVRGNPLIHQGLSRSEEEVRQGVHILETRGDILIQVLWEI